LLNTWSILPDLLLPFAPTDGNISWPHRQFNFGSIKVDLQFKVVLTMLRHPQFKSIIY